MTQPGFADINFGYSAAETEGAQAPELLLDGFLDYGQLTDKALNGVPFLFLGYKGSGKTAIAERAALLAHNDPLLFVHHAWLDTFSFSDFKTAASGGNNAQTQYPTVWSWLLLLTLLHSLQRDEGGREGAKEYHQMVEGVKSLGLLPVPALSDLVTTSSKKSFKVQIPKLLEYAHERAAATQDLQLRQLAAALEQGLKTFRTKSRHVIFVDGLDSLFKQQELQFQSLAALIGAAARLNNAFQKNGQGFKFVVLCRTDIFDRLPGANINKFRQDRAGILEWFDAPKNPDSTRLIRFANLRAKLTLRRDVNIFDEFLPSKLHGRPIRTAILDHTRHTPRDLVQILRYLQEFAPGAGRLTPDQVLSGLRRYSIEHFIPELRNELSGYLDQPQIDQAITLLATLTNQRVTSAELRSRARELKFDGLDLDSLTKILFDASCIGTFEARDGRQPLHSFKYRNRNATLLPTQDMWLHPATLKGLNIEVARARPRGTRSVPRFRGGR